MCLRGNEVGLVQIRAVEPGGLIGVIVALGERQTFIHDTISEDLTPTHAAALQVVRPISGGRGKAGKTG